MFNTSQLKISWSTIMKYWNHHKKWAVIIGKNLRCPIFFQDFITFFVIHILKRKKIPWQISLIEFGWVVHLYPGFVFLIFDLFLLFLSSIFVLIFDSIVKSFWLICSRTLSPTCFWGFEGSLNRLNKSNFDDYTAFNVILKNIRWWKYHPTKSLIHARAAGQGLVMVIIIIWQPVWK